MSQEPQFTSFPRPHPGTRAILEEWGFAILELESDRSETVQVILPEGWQKKHTYLYSFVLLDDQGNKRGDGQCSDCISYFRVNPEYISEQPKNPTLLDKCLSFFRDQRS